MNRVEIMELRAGRELDALIGEKIMGYLWQDCDGYQRLIFMVGESPWFCAVRNSKGTEYTNNLPCFSTDMGAAWELVEKFDNRCMLNNVHGWWECYLPENAKGEARSAPLAICRAALLAIMDA